MFIYVSGGQPGARETKFDSLRLFQNTLLWGLRVSDCNTKWARLIWFEIDAEYQYILYDHFSCYIASI